MDLSAAVKIKRVRGTVASCRLPPALASRAASVAKGAALCLLLDVWIQTGMCWGGATEDGKECVPSPGISCALVADLEDRGVYVAEFMRDPVARR